MNELPQKFTDEEKDAYLWLVQCKARPFFVDLKDKSVLVGWIEPPRRVKNLMEAKQEFIQFSKDKR